MPRSILIAFALVLPAQIFAALSWDSTVYKADALFTDTSTQAVFHFTNTGRTAVAITNMESSCGCTTAAMDKNLYAPGESGEIRARFTYGDRVGAQHKVLFVDMQEGGETSTAQLELFVNIPESVTVNPRIQFWRAGDAPDARPVMIELAQGFPGKPTSARMYSRDSNFSITQPRMTGPGKYELDITPLSTGEAQTEAGEIVVEIPGKEPRKILFYVSIR
jgi:hypothetical protein